MLPKHALYQMSYTEKNLAPRERFELPLPDFVGRCSVQLSQRGKKNFGSRRWDRTIDHWLMRPAGTAAPLLCDNLNWHAGVPYGFRSHLLDLKGR